MPLAKAKKSFRGRYGLIRAGSQFQCEPGYFNQLEKKGWVEEVDVKEPAPSKQREPGPDKNRKKPDAPKRAGGKAGAASGGGKPSAKTQRLGKGSAPAPDSGGPVTSRSLRQDLPSSEPTSSSSGAGDSNSPSCGSESSPGADCGSSSGGE